MRAQQATDREQIRLTRASCAAAENNVHHVGDGIWREDTLQARKQNLPRVVASLANAALSILRMPGVHSLEDLRQVRRRAPATPVVVVSASEAPEDIRSVMQAGAAGFIPKSSSAKVMLGGMASVVKVRANIRNYEDPGWYRHPKGTVASRASIDELRRDGIKT